MFKNSRKKKGSYVWHRNEIKRITKDNYEFLDYKGIILENDIIIKPNSVKLVKIGDEITFRSNIDYLPARCKPGKRIITRILENGIINTDKSLGLHDGAAYTHYERYTEEERKIIKRDKIINKILQ